MTGRRWLQTAALLVFLGSLVVAGWPPSPESSSPSAASLGPSAGSGGPRAGANSSWITGAADLFLKMDPLAAVTASLASRSFLISAALGLVLAIGLIVPRWFCGYFCPLGTLIDIFDWALGRRLPWLAAKRRLTSLNHSWHHLRFYILAALLVAAAGGAMWSGYLSALPLVTRATTALLGPLETGLAGGWDTVPPLEPSHWIAVGLLLAVLALGLFGRRFWCRNLCPTGAIFSALAWFRLTDRRVADDCTRCGRCQTGCSFGAIKPDLTARPANCTFCQTCGARCPTQAITFTNRWSKPAADASPTAAASRAASTSEAAVSRRGLFIGAIGGAGLLALGRTGPAEPLAPADLSAKIRPPGSLPEEEFLATCLRCGNCLQVCPSKVLRSGGGDLGLLGLWTPVTDYDRAGCLPDCAACGQACPTGAIRPLPLEEKRAVHMGRAVVDTLTCLPHASVASCQACVDQCRDAGHNALEFLRVHVELDADGLPDEDTGYLAPVVLADRCVGCGLCQSRCRAVNVREKRLLRRSAIIVQAGPGQADRLSHGSYRALRQEQARRRAQEQPPTPASGSGSDSYLPDFLK